MEKYMHTTKLKMEKSLSIYRNFFLARECKQNIMDLYFITRVAEAQSLTKIVLW